jgi:hypothetical protein
VKNTVPGTRPVPADRLRLAPNGHADPEQLRGLLVDADARAGSSGLVYLAEHTRAADLAPAVGRQGPQEPVRSAGCLPWCAGPHAPAAADTVGAGEHQSRTARLPIPAGMEVRQGDLLSVSLYRSDNEVRPRTWLSFGSGGNGVLLEAAEADQLIGDLLAFVGELSSLRAQMGGNQ